MKQRLAAIPQLSDLHLVQEVQNTDLKLAELGVSAQYLLQTRPAPTYTLTGQSFYTGTFWRYGNTGQFTFQGQHIYQLTPNYGAQLGHAIAAAIVAGQTRSYLKYRTALLNEVVARIERRERQGRTTVEGFYEAHPDLLGHEGLVATVAPWVALENKGLETAALLDAIASRSRAVGDQDRSSLTGDWFGLMVQQNTFSDGTSSPFWLYLRARVVEDGGHLNGIYDLVDGSHGLILATVAGSRVDGRVMNTTYGLGFSIVGSVESDMLVADFQGESEGIRMEGRAVLVR